MSRVLLLAFVNISWLCRAWGERPRVGLETLVRSELAGGAFKQRCSSWLLPFFELVCGVLSRVVWVAKG